MKIKLEITLEKPLQVFGLGIVLGDDYNDRKLIIILGSIAITFSRKYSYENYFKFINLWE